MKIICPKCNCDKFEVHSVGGLDLASGIYLMLQNSSKYFTCVQCEYVIARPSDINALTEIVVYVLGNSLSKQRQGLNIITEKESGVPNPWRNLLFLDGYFAILNPDGSPSKNGPWVFTRAAWKEYQANPEFNLGEEQYVVKIKELF